MKKILIVMFALGAFSLTHAKASSDVALVDILETSQCELKVLKPLLISKGANSTLSGSLSLTTRFREDVIRRLPVGRKLIIEKITDNQIAFKDIAMRTACLKSEVGECLSLGGVSAADIQNLSDNAVEVICKTEQIKDI